MRAKKQNRKMLLLQKSMDFYLMKHARPRFYFEALTTSQRFFLFLFLKGIFRRGLKMVVYTVQKNQLSFKSKKSFRGKTQGQPKYSENTF